MDAMSSVDESDAEPMSTDMLEIFMMLVSVIREWILERYAKKDVITLN